MLLLAFVQAAFASSVCGVELTASWKGDRYTAEAQMVSKAGTAPCRAIDVGSVLEWTPRKAKVVIRQWDDSRQVFGVERFYQSADRWVLHVPEFRAEERLSIRFEAERVDVASIWMEDHVVAQKRSQLLDMEWRAVGNPLFGPDGTVSRSVKMNRTTDAVEGIHRQWWPIGAQEGQCEVWVDDTRLVADVNQFGCAVRVSGGEKVTWKMSWTDPVTSSSDEWLLESHDVVRLRGAEFVSSGIDPTEGREGLQFEGPGRLGVRISRIADVLIQNDALSEVLYAAKAVSLPEPGVGLEFKGYRGDKSAIPVILEKVRSQLVTGVLPEQHPLKPRKLVSVRKSRWGTPWEQALVLSRYLQQLKIPAEAYPVRPALMGPAVEGAPLGFSGAVVRVKTDEKTVWLDPSCAVCGVGEINPALWGGTLFDAQSSQLPSSPAGDISIEQSDDALKVVLYGPPALQLRRWLTQFPVADRASMLASRFGGDGATLVSHDGLVDLGQPITLRIETQSRR